MSRYYIFEIPRDLLGTLQPFKYDFEDSESEASEPENTPEPESSSEESASENEGDIYALAGRKSKFSSTSVTTYADDSSSDDMERWQLAHRAHVTGSPFVYFSSTSEIIPPGKVLTVYKSWFDKHSIVERPLEELRGLPPAGHSAVLMVGGGHFAAAIIEHRRHHHKTNISNPFANVMVKESKTFHRYTTRRKQGGAQSASDAAHGKANSAGSTMRRANERALQLEIKELLDSWAPLLQSCHRIFFRAAGRTSKQLICGYPGAPLAGNDARLASIPFATGRPTLNECKSVWLQLTQAQVVGAPAPAPPKPIKPAAAQTKSPSPAPKEETPEIPADQLLSSQIVDLIKRSKLPALKQAIETKANSNWDFQLQPASKYVAFPTPLLYAAHTEKHNVVSQLLAWGANPECRTASGQSLGEIARPHRKVTDALQISRGKLGESKWNWNKAKVGPPLTAEQILERDTAEKLRVTQENERIASEQAKQEHSDRMERLISKHGSGRLVGGLYEASRGLSEADLRQVERERRARAAEARLTKLNK